MILLVGGTSETAPLAAALVAAGHAVLVSQATETELELPAGLVEVRRGRLDRRGFRRLFEERGIEAVVDASHPFARLLRRELLWACASAELPRVRFERPSVPVEHEVEWADSHEEAARAAVAHGAPILLTTGSRFLSPYRIEASARGIALHARILPGAESLQACRAAGFPLEDVAFARGPFDVAATRGLLERWRIGVLVAKDGGAASGLAERLEAARSLGVQVVLVRRPPEEPDAVSSPAEVVARLAGFEANGARVLLASFRALRPREACARVCSEYETRPRSHHPGHLVVCRHLARGSRS